MGEWLEGFFFKVFVVGPILLHLALVFVSGFARVSSLSEMASAYGDNPAIMLICIIPGACYLLLSFILVFAAPVPSYFLLTLALLVGIPVLAFFTSLGLWALVAMTIAIGVIFLTGGALVPLLTVLIAPGVALAVFLLVAGGIFVFLDSMLMFF